MRQMRKKLCEVSCARTVGFRDAIEDIGKHMLAGQMVYYSKKQVYDVLKGKTKSRRLLERIAERRSDLFRLRYVADEVVKFYEGWCAEHGVEKPITPPLRRTIRIYEADAQVIDNLAAAHGQSVADVVNDLVGIGMKTYKNHLLDK